MFRTYFLSSRNVFSKNNLLFFLQLPFDICLSNLGTIQNRTFNKIQKLQDNALRITNFLPYAAPIQNKATLKILKLSHYISLQSALLVKICFEKQLP